MMLDGRGGAHRQLGGDDEFLGGNQQGVVHRTVPADLGLQLDIAAKVALVAALEPRT